MDDVVVLEAADHVRDRVGFANVGEELVRAVCLWKRAGDEPGDVDELDDGGYHLLGLRDHGELRKTRILVDDPTLGSIVQNG